MPEIQVHLRPITEADLPDYVRWLNDPEVTEFTSFEAGGITLEGEREWLAQISAPDCGTRNWAIEADGRHIGNCGLHLNASQPTADFGIIIGDKTAWGKGCGAAALREVLRKGFEEMGLRRIFLDAFSANTRAIRCYEKCGFRHEGMQRQARLKRGKWLDLVRMAILREEWEAMAEPREGDGICIREFVLGEYEQVSEIWRAAGLSSRPSDTRDEVAKKLRRDPDLFLVACDGPRIVGTVIGGWDGRRGWIYRMAVQPGYRGQGVGHMLMRELEMRFRAKGICAINLIYNSDNTNARAFYHSLGYQDREGVSVLAKTLEKGGEKQ